MRVRRGRGATDSIVRVFYSLAPFFGGFIPLPEQRYSARSSSQTSPKKSRTTPAAGCNESWDCHFPSGTRTKGNGFEPAYRGRAPL